MIAHGAFLDELAAVRHGAQRPLGGAAAWQRPGLQVDVSPLSVATLAVWGLIHGPVTMYDLRESVH